MKAGVVLRNDSGKGEERDSEGGGKERQSEVTESILCGPATVMRLCREAESRGRERGGRG